MPHTGAAPASDSPVPAKGPFLGPYHPYHHRTISIPCKAEQVQEKLPGQEWHDPVTETYGQNPNS